jgi:hypothetical protein
MFIMKNSIVGVSNTELFTTIATNLGQNNLYLETFDQTSTVVDGYIRANTLRRYVINETKSSDTINLANLDWWIREKLEMNPKFQRNSNDHKTKTPQQIVVDYLSNQILGSILLYKPFGSSKKWVVDGRHRITHLKSFIDGDLVLRGDEARDFWALYLKQIQILVNSKSSDVNLNKLLTLLANPKNKDGALIFPEVNFKKLPSLIKDEILNGVKLDLNEISVSVQDVDGNGLSITEEDSSRIDKIIWRKFTRMNFNSAKITVDDSVWNLPIPYNENSTNLASDSTIKSFFGLTIDNMDQTKKLNEILFTMMLFLDKKFSWGGSTKLIVNNHLKAAFQRMGNESENFFKVMNGSFSKGFGRMISRGEIIDIPSEFKSIKGGNVTNIRQLLLFMYLLHKKSTHPLYNEIPTHFHRNVLTLGSKIIKVCVFDKNGQINQEELVRNGLVNLYTEHTSLFNKIAEFRKNQRKYEDVISLYSDLVDLCVSVVY